MIQLDEGAFNDSTATTILYDFITLVTSSVHYEDLIIILFQIHWNYSQTHVASTSGVTCFICVYKCTKPWPSTVHTSTVFDFSV